MAPRFCLLQVEVETESPPGRVARRSLRLSDSGVPGRPPVRVPASDSGVPGRPPVPASAPGRPFVRPPPSEIPFVFPPTVRPPEDLPVDIPEDKVLHGMYGDGQNIHRVEEHLLLHGGDVLHSGMYGGCGRRNHGHGCGPVDAITIAP